MSAADRSERLQCPHVERCGGCSLSDLDYGGQLDAKVELVRSAFAGYAALAKVELAPLAPAPSMVGYRIREKLVVDGRQLGLFARGTHDVVDIPECRLTSSRVERVISAVRRRLPLPFTLFGIDVREVDAGALLTLIVGHDVDERDLEPCARELVRDEPSIVGVSLSRRHKKAPRLLGTAPQTVIGHALARHRLAPSLPYHLAAPGSFVQGHASQAVRLYADVEAVLTARLGSLENKRVLELFAGSGSLALQLAARGADVTAIDSHEPGIRALERAAREQGIELVARAERAELTLASQHAGYDAVIVDPPRRGLPPELRRELARSGARVLVYVSCEPSTLARDLSHLTELGYCLRELKPFDLLPLSASVELLAVLEPGPRPEPRVVYQDERWLAVDAPAFADGLSTALAERFAAVVPLGPESWSGIRLFARGQVPTDAPSCAAEYSVLVRGVIRHHGRLRSARYVRQRIVGTHSLITVQAPLGRSEVWARELSRVGHPVLGDTRYGDHKSNRHFLELHGLDRPFLHLARLKVAVPERTLESQLAPDLAAVLESLASAEHR